MEAAAGWYPDHWVPVQLRWWDGFTWTGHTSAPSRREVPETPPTFPAKALPWAIGGVVASVVLARVVSELLFNQLGVSTTVFVGALYLMLFGGLWLTCSAISRSYGTGAVVRDFGLSWKLGDLWRGALGFVAAGLAQGIARLPWLGRTGRLERLTEGLGHVSLATFVIFAVAAVVAAPILEELTFRGMLQRSLAARAGPRWALIGQAIACGLYHFTPGLGSENAPYVVGLIAAGLVFGWLAQRCARLGPSNAAHLLANALAVLTLAAHR
jgi:membrane protease YdiL (CAAX protease family)